MKKAEDYKFKKLFKFKTVYKKMDKKIIKFEGTKTEEYKFHQNKSSISIKDIDISFW